MTSIWDSYSSHRPRIVSPPLPISRPIWLGSIWTFSIRGAYWLSAWRGAVDDLGHLGEDERACLVRLRQRVAQDVERDARDLDVHLQRGDPVLGAGDLEVHVAEVVLDAGDVGQDDVVIALLDQAHRDARDRRGSAARLRPSATASEPQTEAIEDEPLDSKMSETTRTV